MNLCCRGFDFCPEVTAKALRLGHRIHEVPIEYSPRTLDEGKKIRAWHGIQALWVLLKYRLMPTDKLLASPKNCAAAPSVVASASQAQHHEVEEVVPAF
jgi:hypothetical protein